MSIAGPKYSQAPIPQIRNITPNPSTNSAKGPIANGAENGLRGGLTSPVHSFPSEYLDPPVS